MPYLKKSTMEKIAERVLNAYWLLPEAEAETATRVVPELLAQEIVGLSIEYWHLSPDMSILGQTTCQPGFVQVADGRGVMRSVFMTGRKVLIEQNLLNDPTQFGRHNFTLMHETSHQIFKILFPQSYLQNMVHFCRSTSQKDDWEEWRTNYLASAILMPKNLILKNMEAVGLGHQISRLNRVFNASEYELFCEVADRLGVSKTALSIRMVELGLLKKNYLNDPYALVKITADAHETF